MNALRYDRSNLTGSAKRTDEGYIEDKPVVTRTGVFPYLNPDGTIRHELRHPIDVYAADSLATLALLPVTNGHPAERVTADNAKVLAVGCTGERADVDGADVRIMMRVTDAAAVSVVDNGRRELSCGYTVDLIEGPGVYDGKPYTHRQTNIRYNHLALVDRARVGSTARLNIDGAEQIQDETETGGKTPRKDQAAMRKVNIDGIEYDAAPEVANALTKAQAAITQANADAAAATKRADTMEAERDAAIEKAKQLEAANNADAIAAGVKSRLALVSAAASVLPKEVADKLETMSDADIRTAVIKAASPEANLDGRSDDYIIARYDAAVESLGTNKRNDASAAQRMATFPRQDGGGSAQPEDAARSKMLADRANRHAAN